MIKGAVLVGFVFVPYTLTFTSNFNINFKVGIFNSFGV